MKQYCSVCSSDYPALVWLQSAHSWTWSIPFTANIVVFNQLCPLQSVFGSAKGRTTSGGSTKPSRKLQPVVLTGNVTLVALGSQLCPHTNNRKRAERSWPTNWQLFFWQSVFGLSHITYDRVYRAGFTQNKPITFNHHKPGRRRQKAAPRWTHFWRTPPVLQQTWSKYSFGVTLASNCLEGCLR